MASNPDFGNYLPNNGDLRFVEREVDNHGVPAKASILQRWEWSYADGKWDWYDVTTVSEE